MEEIKFFAKTVMQCKSFEVRQQCLEESLNTLSFDYPDLYSQLFREIKKRELAFNDPLKITKWLSTSNPDAIVKLHEALILVKSYNVKAKEEYLNNLKQILCQTIKNETNIDLTMKICDLIEKSPHLKTIYDRLIYLIQQVKELNIYKQNNHVENYEENAWTGLLNQIPVVDAFGQLNIQSVPYIQPEQHSPVWPSMLIPTNLKSAQGSPRFNFDAFGYNHFNMIATVDRFSTSNFTQEFSNQTIVSQDMDDAIYKWLHYLKLHKYQWFFNALSYSEIESIDDDNIEGFIMKVNRNSITKGAQRKICASAQALRNRPQKLKEISLALDLEVATNKLHEFILLLKEMLYYPIPNKHCVGDKLLQQDIVLVMGKFLNQLLGKLNASGSFTNLKLLGPTFNTYLECTSLITKNQLFTKEQYDKIIIYAESLKCLVKNKQNIVHS